MKRLSTKLISSAKITIPSTSISGIQFTTYSSPISKSPIQNLNPYSNSNDLFNKPYKTHQFYEKPSENYTTHVGNSGSSLYFSSNESKSKKLSSVIQEVVKAVKAAKSTVEMLEVVKDMEDMFDEGEHGVACLNVVLELTKEGEDPEKILSFALVLLDNLEDMDYLRNSLVIEEFLMGKDSREFGDANSEFARRLLGIVYAGFEEHEKAVEDHESPIYKNPTSNLSMNWVRYFSTGGPSNPHSFFDQTDPKMWTGVTKKIVDKFKSACLYDEFLVSPTGAFPRRQVIHLDGRFYKPGLFQVGMVSRSPEGKVVWAAMSRFSINTLLPKPYKMNLRNPDVTLTETSAMAYLAIRLRELGISDPHILVVTDSRQSMLNMGPEDNNTINNKPQKFLAVITKKLWFYCILRRVIWVKGDKNLAADGLSRAIDLSDANEKHMKQYYETVEAEVANFYERILNENETENSAVDVKRGKEFDKDLKECMRVIDK